MLKRAPRPPIYPPCGCRLIFLMMVHSHGPSITNPSMAPRCLQAIVHMLSPSRWAPIHPWGLEAPHRTHPAQLGQSALSRPTLCLGPCLKQMLFLQLCQHPFKAQIKIHLLHEASRELSVLKDREHTVGPWTSPAWIVYP